MFPGFFICLFLLLTPRLTPVQGDLCTLLFYLYRKFYMILNRTQTEMGSVLPYTFPTRFFNKMKYIGRRWMK